MHKSEGIKLERLYDTEFNFVGVQCMKIINHVKRSSQIIILWCIFYEECLKGI